MPNEGQVKSSDELFPVDHNKCIPPPPLATEFTPEDHKELLSKFSGRFVGISWLLSPEPAKEKEPLLDLTVDVILATYKHLGSDILLSRMHLSHEQVMTIQAATVGQTDNKLWHLMRKGRLTASNFGCVLSAKRATPSLISRLCVGKDLDKVLSVQWGRANEPEGIKAFEEATGKKVID